MSVALSVARVATVLNAALLLGLMYVWVRSYRRVRASHTLGLLVFAALLFLENALAIYLYNFHPVFHAWLDAAAPVAQSGMMALTILEFAALAFLVRITWV